MATKKLAMKGIQMSMYEQTKIIKYSHFFKVVNPTYQIKSLIHNFIRPLVIFERVKPVGEKARFMPTKVFSSRTADEKEYRLHINQFKDFITYLHENHIAVSEIPVETVEMYKPARLKWPVKITKQPRDYQIKPIDRIVHLTTGYRAVLLGLPTGTGKTFSGLYGCYKVGTRVAIIILPIYIEKWVEDIQTNLGVDPKSIMIVQGSQHLAGLIDLAKNNQLSCDYIIISTVTMRMFIEKYDENPVDCLDQYGIFPYDLYKVCQVGQILIDETHQHLHAVFKIHLTMHVPQLTTLTATLITDQPVIKKVHDLMYPKECRYDELLMKKYINAIAIDYSYRDFQYRKIRTTDFGSTTYSHTAYEKSIMRNDRNLSGYLDMIGYFITNSYMKERKEGDKFILFVATIKFGEVVIGYLKQMYPDLIINRYMEKDPLSNIAEADGIVSTIVSAGTAIDIPNLTHVFMTVNVNSPVANAQSLGRLREIKEKEVYFYYFYCRDIKKHVDNNWNRKIVFADRVKTLKELQYPRFL